MKKVKVRYYNTIADYLGRREEVRELSDGATLLDLVEGLAKESASFRNLVQVVDGDYGGRLRLFCNEQLVLDYAHKLADGDKVQVFLPVSGG
jgi:molybdopterin converting factor small subunit